jgi:signal transduction histidine kinase
MRHRIAGLGGIWDIRTPATGGTVVTARIPLSRMLIPETAEATLSAAQSYRG